jgi:hypothetical protein
MKQAIAILRDQDGNAIVIAMMILVLLTIIGTSATRNTTVELQVVRNDLVHREQLYRAESAAIQGSQWMKKSAVSDLEDYSARPEMSQNDLNLTTLDLNDGTWLRSDSDPIGTGNVICGYRIVDETGPIDLGSATNLHTYTVYGLFDQTGGMNRGQVLIAIGYKRRF